MPTKKLPDGTILDFKDVHELIAYEKAMGTVVTPVLRSTIDPSWTRLMRELAGEAHGEQRKILNLVKAAGQVGISRGDLALRLGIATNQGVGGRIAGITKACRRIELEDLTPVIVSDGKNYFAGPLLRANEVPE